MFVLASWTVGLLLIGLWLDKIAFLVAGAILGSGLGGVAVTDRLLLLRLTKPEEVGEMLGLYGMAGKLSAVIGPLMFGAIVFAARPGGERRDRLPGRHPVAAGADGDRLLDRAPGAGGHAPAAGRDPAGGAARAGHRAARRGARMTLVVAHRGASVQAPENTMESFRLGAEAGADAIELDVHLTSDGQLAVIHDETVDRTTDGIGKVASFTLERSAEAGRRGAIHGRRRLHALCRQGRHASRPWRRSWTGCPMTWGWWSRSRPALRHPRWWRRCASVRSAGTDRAIVISFDEAAIEEVHALDPELPTGYLLVPNQPFEPALRWAVEHGHAAVHTWEGDLGLDPAPALSQAAAYGRQIGCYVVNDPDRMKQLAAYGLWGFVTDVPDVARAALGPRGGA